MTNTSIDYRQDVPLTLEAFMALYRASTLAERRPIDQPVAMQRMMDNADLTITAWQGKQLVGISRILTDFGHAAYLADLAVSRSCQGRGIGRRLIELTRAALPNSCPLVLFAAPAANDFYRHLGFIHNDRGWMLPGD